MDTLREDCCVCLRRTRRRTPCQHPLCRHCFKRLRRRECPYCRSELVMTVQEIQRRPTPLSPEDLELLRNCDSLDQLHEVALTLSGKMPTSSPSDRRNVVAAVAKRCCCFTSLGWRSQLDATAAARVMSGLVEDGLLEPSQSLQSAIVDALLQLCSHPARPSRPVSACGRRPVSASLAQSKAPGLPCWLQKLGLLATFAGSRLITDGANSVASLLLDDLRRCLPDTARELLASTEELGRGAALLLEVDSASGANSLSSLRRVLAEALGRLESLEGAGRVAEVKSVLKAMGLARGDEPSLVKPGERRRPKSAAGNGAVRKNRPAPLSARIAGGM
mmetsp:Transcript_39745/g.81401  ORF Transcript_39745/g.81401 Transcript_39745/m.81401 type:complete len:333 (-) Transcript_39745:4-1002(-)